MASRKGKQFHSLTSLFIAQTFIQKGGGYLQSFFLDHRQPLLFLKQWWFSQQQLENRVSWKKESAPFREAKHNTMPASFWHSEMPLFGYGLHTFPVLMHPSCRCWIVSIVCDKLWIGDDEMVASWKGAELIFRIPNPLWKAFWQFENWQVWALLKFMRLGKKPCRIVHLSTFLGWKLLLASYKNIDF